METYDFKNTLYNIYIGKNKYNNWELIDNATENDVWFHVANSSSSHIILETDIPINKIPIQVIKRCACLCKSHSSSRSVKDCEIIYTNIKNITKTKNVGEVIATNTKRIVI